VYSDILDGIRWQLLPEKEDEVQEVFHSGNNEGL
jgi:hypothetical protein